MEKPKGTKTEFSRRDFVKRAVGGATLTLAYSVGANTLMLSPREAKARSLAVENLTAAEADDLALLADTMLPGADDAGVVHFVDHQLGASPDNCMLVAKYFEVTPPYIDFYRTGLKNAGELSQATFEKALLALSPEQVDELVGKMSAPGQATFLFYLCLRSDAVDVVYGTQAGFKKLNVPYMAHILPPEKWDG